MTRHLVLVTHPKSYVETTDCRDFGGKVEVRTGVGFHREKLTNFVAWAEPDPKTAFFAFLGYPSTILRTAYS